MSQTLVATKCLLASFKKQIFFKYRIITGCGSKYGAASLIFWIFKGILWIKCVCVCVCWWMHIYFNFAFVYSRLSRVFFWAVIYILVYTHIHTFIYATRAVCSLFFVCDRQELWYVCRFVYSFDFLMCILLYK